MAEQKEKLSPSDLEVYEENHPTQRIVAKRTVEGGRGLLLTVSKGQSGTFDVNFMGQTFFIPDKDYRNFLPEALRAALDKLEEVEGKI